MKRSAVPVWGTILEQVFEELISAIRNMIGAINSLQQRMIRHWRGAEDLEEKRKPQQHDQEGYWQVLDEREAPRTTRMVQEDGCPVEGGVGHP